MLLLRCGDAPVNSGMLKMSNLDVISQRELVQNEYNQRYQQAKALNRDEKQCREHAAKISPKITITNLRTLGP